MARSLLIAVTNYGALAANRSSISMAKSTARTKRLPLPILVRKIVLAFAGNEKTRPSAICDIDVCRFGSKHKPRHRGVLFRFST